MFLNSIWVSIDNLGISDPENEIHGNLDNNEVISSPLQGMLQEITF